MLLRNYQPKAYNSTMYLFKTQNNFWNIGLAINKSKVSNYLGWEQVVSDSKIILEEASGNHFNLVYEPHVIPLAKKITTYLNNCLDLQNK